MTNELSTVLKAFSQLERAYLSQNKNTDEFLAAVSMFESMTYRLLSTSANDRLIGFRMIYRLLKQLGNGHKDIVLELDPHSKTMIIGGGIKLNEMVVQYIRQSSGDDIKSYIEKDSLLLSKRIPMSQVMTFLPFAFKQAFRCIFNWRRINIALTIHELLEISAVLKYVRENEIEHVYDFFPYEKDSNFMTLILRAEGVRITKNPSPGPLATHNRILIADIVTVSTPYQLEELKKFSETIRVKEYLLWPPERAFTYYQRYINHIPAERNTIGFYSHGQWIRKAQGHSDDGVTSIDGESQILGWLKQLLVEMPQFKLIIFPHPRERYPENIESMKAYYRSKLGEVNYEVITDGVKTMQALEKVDIAVVLFSTVIYERLFCGYKTLIGNNRIRSFPMNMSPLNNICFQNYEGMRKLIIEFADKDEDYFFTKTNLQDYKFTNYKMLRS